MAEQKLDFNALEARGIWALRSQILAAQQQLETLSLGLRAADGEAEKALKGRVPAGVNIRMLRIDEQKNEVWAPAPPEPPKEAPQAP